MTCAIVVVHVLSDIFMSQFQDPLISVTQTPSAPDTSPAESQSPEGECTPVQRPGDPGSWSPGDNEEAGDSSLVPNDEEGPGERHGAL